MIEQLQSMPVEELQKFLNRLELLDSSQAASFVGVKQQTMRAPTGRYKRLGIKIGQYWFWRRGDLEMFLPDFDTYIRAQKAGWVRINPNKTVYHHGGTSIKCLDVTSWARDGVDFGGQLAIVVNDQELARSHELYIGGKYAQYFRVTDVKQAIERAKEIIEAARRRQY